MAIKRSQLKLSRVTCYFFINAAPLFSPDTRMQQESRWHLWKQMERTAVWREGMSAPTPSLGTLWGSSQNAREHCGSLVGVPAAARTHFLSDRQWLLFSIILGAFEEDSPLMGSWQLHAGSDHRKQRGHSEPMSVPHPRPCCSFPDTQAWEDMKGHGPSLCWALNSGLLSSPSLFLFGVLFLFSLWESHLL